MAQISNGGSQMDSSYGIAPVGTPDPAPAPAPIAAPAPLTPEVLAPSMSPETAMVATNSDNMLPAQVQQDVMNALAGPVGEQLPPQVGAPYLMFFHDRSEQASAVLAACPHASIGQPFIIDDTRIVELPQGYRFTVLMLQPYWAEIDISDGSHSRVTFVDPGRSDKRKKNVITVSIIDSGVEFFATCTTWRTAKCPAPISQARATQISALPEWVTRAPSQDKQKIRSMIVKATGPATVFRVWSTVTLRARKGKQSGMTYHEAAANPVDAELTQLTRVNEWLSNGGQDQIAVAIRAYQDRLAYLQANV